MDKLKVRFRRLLTPRQNSDLASEVLNIVGWPIYVYTISYVVYFGYDYLVDYHYGNGNPDGRQSSVWYFQKCLACLIWVQMMSNWACIRYADTSLKTEVKRWNNQKAQEKEVPIQESANGNNNSKSNSAHSSNGQTKRISIGKAAQTSHASTLTKKISYWSWKYCHLCKLNAPPRCHHCPFCDTCILKRDHHCFFAGSCVGFHNQRHFIVFLVWAAFGTTYAMIHFFPYLYNIVLQDISALDCFAPVAVFRLFAGQIDFYHANLVVSFTLNFFFIFLSTGFLIEQYNLVTTGLTQFEQTKVDTRKLKIVDPRSFSQKMRAVLGQYPVVSLMFPWAHWIFPPKDDPFEWPEHKIKHC